MHAGNHEAPAHAVTETEADACCAASERKQSETPSPTIVTALPAPMPDVCVVPAPVLPAGLLRELWRADVPGPAPPVPRHLLLSVFLI